MEFGDRQLEKKIANIKSSLKELKESLLFEEIFEKPQKDLHMEGVRGKPESLNERVDLKMLYEYEKQKNLMLEARILHKDELLTEMTFLQNELYANIEELQNKVASLNSDLDYTRSKVKQVSVDLDRSVDLIKDKDLEITRLIQEKDQYFSYVLEKNEESKVLHEELNSVGPDKKLLSALERRNQELLLEIDELQHQIRKINTSQVQVLKLQEKLRVCHDEKNALVRNHSVEVAGLQNKIKVLEMKIVKMLSGDVQKEKACSVTGDLKTDEFN